jgi:hypothetical protein
MRKKKNAMRALIPVVLLPDSPNEEAYIDRRMDDPRSPSVVATLRRCAKCLPPEKRKEYLSRVSIAEKDAKNGDVASVKTLERLYRAWPSTE